MRIRLHVPRLFVRVGKEIRRFWRRRMPTRLFSRLFETCKKLSQRVSWALHVPGNCHKLRRAVNEVLEAQSRRLKEVADVCAVMDPLLHAQSQRLEQQEKATVEQANLLAELVRTCDSLEAAVTAQNQQLAWLAKSSKTRIATGCREDEEIPSADSLQELQQRVWEAFGILAKKVEILALDVRERVTPVENLPEPRIVDAGSYAQKLQVMPDGLRVNVGCGEKPSPDHVNVDARQLPEVEVVADAGKLPFEPGSVTELYSAHLIEHFREHHFATVILPHWRKALQPDGRLRIVCPNWEEMLRRVASGEIKYDDFKTVTFGSQDYEGDDHFAMYTPKSLTRLLEQAGFHDVRMVCDTRPNGLCSEMELTAVANTAAAPHDNRAASTASRQANVQQDADEDQARPAA